jgi:hypothetical protein
VSERRPVSPVVAEFALRSRGEWRENCVAMSKAWLNAPDRGENISGEYQIVYDRNQAGPMSNANAQQLMRAAQDTYTDYTWEMVPVQSGCGCIVEGTKKK